MWSDLCASVDSRSQILPESTEQFRLLIALYILPMNMCKYCKQERVQLNMAGVSANSRLLNVPAGPTLCLTRQLSYKY